jgi:hypothetical protein
MTVLCRSTGQSDQLLQQLHGPQAQGCGPVASDGCRAHGVAQGICVVQYDCHELIHCSTVACCVELRPCVFSPAIMNACVDRMHCRSAALFKIQSAHSLNPQSHPFGSRMHCDFSVQSTIPAVTKVVHARSMPQPHLLPGQLSGCTACTTSLDQSSELHLQLYNQQPQAKCRTAINPAHTHSSNAAPATGRRPVACAVNAHSSRFICQCISQELSRPQPPCDAATACTKRAAAQSQHTAKLAGYLPV